jgi:hypothetical protein
MALPVMGLGLAFVAVKAAGKGRLIFCSDGDVRAA